MSLDDRLKILRLELDELDTKIFNLLIKRYELCKEIGKLKHSLNIPLYQQERYNEKKNKIITKAKKANLPPDYLEEIYELIHKFCIKVQSME